MPTALKSATERSIEALVKEHQKRKDEPLHLALQFGDPKHRKDVLLLEVIGNFGGGHIEANKRFFEMEMTATSVVGLPPGGKLRFIFTSPEELKEASSKNWPALKRLKENMAMTSVTVHHADATGRSLRSRFLAT